MSREFRLMELFCATVARVHSGVRVPMNNRAFALVVDELKAKGNSLVAWVPTYNGPAGKTCPTFNDMMSLALHSAIICYLSPEYSHFVSNLSPRGSETIMRRVQATDDEKREAEELVALYWEKAV